VSGKTGKKPTKLDGWSVIDKSSQFKGRGLTAYKLSGTLSEGRKKTKVVTEYVFDRVDPRDELIEGSTVRTRNYYYQLGERNG